MNFATQKEPLVLFIGDICVFLASLWLALFIRYGEFPDRALLGAHVTPFLLLFAAWALVFFIAGLYNKHTSLLRSRLPQIIFKAQFVNTALAVLFFYLVQTFGITPKTTLFIYLLTSFVLVLFWRISLYPFLGARRKQKAILLGSGTELRELKEEVNRNPRYSLIFVSSVDLDNLAALDFQEEILQRIYTEDISIIVVDLKSEKAQPLLPHLYNLLFSKVRFVDMYKVYEDVFDRVPLSLVRYNWFLENISRAPHVTYDILKRLMDIIISIPLLLVPVLCYPFILVAVKVEDGGLVFTHQNRVGKNNRVVRLVKYRTMLFNDGGDWKEKGRENKITRVGAFLRKSRLDEFPQLWNVLLGDISLIGPRPEFPEPVRAYEKQVPYYGVRHLLKPGLSGWAQIHHDEAPHHGVDVEETKKKLSYDLYYIKNRSLLLDLKIALHTIRILLSRRGV